MNYPQAVAPKPPLSRHPAFVPLVAVWLAALLGGSMAVLPAQTIANIPVAMPQLAMAGAAAIIGATLGWLAAKLVASSQRRAAEARRVGQDAADEAPSEAASPLTIAELEETDDLDDAPVAQAGDSIEPAGHDELQEIIVPELQIAMPSPASPQVITSDQTSYADNILADMLGGGNIRQSEDVPVVEVTVEPYEAPEPSVDAAEFIEAEAEAPTEEAEGPAVADAEPREPDATVVFPQHGKAVNLLRGQQTGELAMPQRFERLAVAIDDQRQVSENSAHTYTGPPAPEDLAKRLRSLAEGRRTKR